MSRKTTHRFLLAGLFALVASLHSEACGPFFQVMLTTCGSACLLSAPDRNYFAPELAEVFPGTQFSGSPPEPTGITTRALSLKSATPVDRVRLHAALAAQSGAESYRLGAGLPEAARLYAAGAVEFRLSRLPNSHLPDRVSPSTHRAPAIAYFQRIVDLPEVEAGPRRLWALYSLGRLWRDDGSPPALERAAKAFQRVARESRRPQADPMGLGPSAMGQLGAIALAGNRLAEATDWYVRAARVSANSADEESLIEVAARVLDVPGSATGEKRLAKRLRNPQLQRLVAAYTVANLQQSEQPWQERHATLLAAIRQLPDSAIVEPDRLGLVAFRFKDYELASRLLVHPRTPPGRWVAAKLALYQGNIDVAAAQFAAASRGFPANGANTHDANRFHAEWALLQMRRGDYAEALSQLDRLTEPYADVKAFEANLGAPYWLLDQIQRARMERGEPLVVTYADYYEPLHFRKDVAWVAERVMTTNELVDYVDTHRQASWLVRSILSRRLVREGRYRQAIHYAYTKADADRIRHFVDARARATDRQQSLDVRIRAVLRAADIEMNEGLELRGTELYPDYAAYRGNFALEEYERDIMKPSDLADTAERERVAASATKPTERFHYRRVAAERLVAFSHTLPAHSEELTVFLCEAYGLTRRGPGNRSDLMTRFYRDYQQRGRWYDGDRRFGNDCPKLHGIAIAYDRS